MATTKVTSLAKEVRATLVTRLEKAAEKDRSRNSLDRKHHVMHMSTKIVANQLLHGQPADVIAQAPAVYKALKEYYSKNRISNPKELSKYLVTSNSRSSSFTGVVMFSPTNAKDFVLFASNFGKIQTSLGEVAKALGTKFPFLLRNITNKKTGEVTQARSFDVGHVGTGLHAAQNTPVLHTASLVKKLLSKAKIGGKALDTVNKAARRVKQVHAQYDSSYKKSATMSSLSGHFDFVYTIPQNFTLNQQLLGKEEQTAAAELASVAMTIKGSDSLEQSMDKIIHAALFDKTYKSSSLEKIKGKARGPKQKAKIVPKVPKKRKGPKQTKAGPSALQLMTLINLSLTDQVKDNMKRPALRNQTGRFAESVRIQNATVGRGGLTTFQYDYAKSPYQTFENSSRWPKGYDPRPLIAGSIREIASQLMQTKFRSVRL